MTRTSMIGRAAAAVALLSAIAATAAFAHGNPDQMNDPPTSSGWYCAQEGADQLYQGFVPTRRLLSAFEIRIFKRFNFPASGMTLAGRVHIGTGTGAVVGTATATVPPGGPDELLVHFDFSPAAVLEPQGTFVFELAQPESGIRWMGRNDNPYAAAPSFDCDASTVDATIDFNFGSYMPPDGGPPQTSIDRPASGIDQPPAHGRADLLGIRRPDLLNESRPRLPAGRQALRAVHQPGLDRRTGRRRP